MAPSDNIATLRRVVHDINHGDLTSTGNAVTADFARHDLTGLFAAKHSGGEEVTNFLGALMAAMPDLRIDFEDVFAVDDRVTARYRISGTHNSELLGVAATGRKIEFSGINIYRFEGDKFAEVWQLWDWAGVLRQLGVLGVGEPAA
jgi:steroid delta-isomerase-like uncharacterized protein